MSRTSKAALLWGLIAVAAPGAASAIPWSWDMFSQPSHKAQEETALPMPKDSVPTGGKTAFGVKTKEGSLNLSNPVPPTESPLCAGGALQIYCAICHGDTGHGDGKWAKIHVAGGFNERLYKKVRRAPSSSP